MSYPRLMISYPPADSISIQIIWLIIVVRLIMQFSQSKTCKTYDFDSLCKNALLSLVALSNRSLLWLSLIIVGGFFVDNCFEFVHRKFVFIIYKKQRWFYEQQTAGFSARLYEDCSNFKPKVYNFDFSQFLNNQLGRTSEYTSQSKAVPTTTTQSSNALPLSNNIDLQLEWPLADRQNFLRDMLIIEDFLSESEEEALFSEVDPYMKRLRYEFDHWDDVSILWVYIKRLVIWLEFVRMRRYTDSGRQNAKSGIRTTKRWSIVSMQRLSLVAFCPISMCWTWPTKESSNRMWTVQG